MKTTIRTVAAAQNQKIFNEVNGLIGFKDAQLIDWRLVIFLRNNGADYHTILRSVLEAIEIVKENNKKER